MNVPALDEIKAARERLGKQVRRTPVWQWKSDGKDKLFGPETELFMKLELLQYGGSFKCRGSLTHVMGLSEDQKKRGVTAVSAGNHAIAVAYAAKATDISAKVVMPKTANKARIKRCRSMGAEVVLVENVHAAFDKVNQIEKQEGRYFIHPFEGYLTALGTATAGLEWAQQVENLDAVIVPVGGGGLIAGVASCMKQIDANITVYGVEPEGADSMSRSFASGKPEEIDSIHTIADSLGSPMALPYSFGLCQKFVDGMVTISGRQMTSAMQLLFDELKLAVEPAAASATAALQYKLLDELQGQRVGIMVCGTNIDLETYYQNITNYQEM